MTSEVGQWGGPSVNLLLFRQQFQCLFDLLFMIIEMFMESVPRIAVWEINASCDCSSNTCLSAHTISSMWLENVLDNEGWQLLSLSMTFIETLAQSWYHFYTYWMGITFALYTATVCGYLRVLCLVHTGTGEHHALFPLFPHSIQLPFPMWCCTGGDICHVAVEALTNVLQSNSWLQ